jgi:hypothetical protein
VNYNTPNNASLLTPKKVASWLGVSISCLKKQRFEQRSISYLKIGSSVRDRPADVEAYIAEHLVLPHPEVKRA